jgi:pimeloyl-ACP methyl ester carboxylesterase
MAEFVTDDDVRLHYVVQGDGPLPILYLHWMGGDTSNWAMLWACLGAKKFRHVAFDFRGHGRSEPKPSTFTSERLARDALQLADALGLNRFVVAGHGFGGKVAFKLVAMAPARVAGLVLMGAIGPGKIPIERDALEPILGRTGEIAFVREWFRPWFAVWPRAELDRALEIFARTPAWAHRARCEIALWTDISTETAGLTTPALVVVGERDPAYGSNYQRGAVLPALPHAQSVTVDCGHGLILERPEEIAGYCTTFFASLRA